MVEGIFIYLSESIGVQFTCHRMNYKPFIDEENATLLIVITDLAAGLRHYYNRSSKFGAQDNYS